MCIMYLFIFHYYIKSLIILSKVARQANFKHAKYKTENNLLHRINNSPVDEDLI